MKISYNWLQTYFNTTLPSPEELAELITFHAFEIEGIEKVSSDTILDIKVLPDRAHYALSHRGIAYEVSAIAAIPMHDKSRPPGDIRSKKEVKVVIEEKELCLRYMARYIENVRVADSPVWLKQWLDGMGQRSINNIVDATNFVMLDIGQPLHAFDADKVKGGITVRRAKEHEHITTLDGKDVKLDTTILIIADDEGPLAIAGVKGGNRAAVTDATRNIILESASFDASSVRKTSQKVGIRNDSSKRFENNVPSIRAEKAIHEVSELIGTMTENALLGPITDIYPKPRKEMSLKINVDSINNLLGVQIPEPEIEQILKRLDIPFTHKNSLFNLTIPPERLDLVIAEDMVEEIGRIYGYLKIPVTSLPNNEQIPKLHKQFYYTQKIRDALVKMGFSEVYTYALTNAGDVEILNPLASDKNFLRSHLMQGIQKSLELNVRHADLLGLKQIKIFEIGNVFTAEGEHASLALGIRHAQKSKKKEADELKEIVSDLGSELSLDLNFVETKDGVAEIDLDNMVRNLPEPEDFQLYDVSPQQKIYKPISVYPFAVRDLAVFTPEGTTEHDVRAIIETHGGSLLVRITLFDVFEKAMPEGIKKISYAFRLVFQSHEKTLTEEEINSIMKKITDDMNTQKGWQVR